MENRTEIGQVRRFLTLKEIIRAKEYFEVYIYHNSLFLIYGDGDIRYQVTAPDMNRAISKALEIHHEGWPTDTEEDEPSYITKYQVIRKPDEQILDEIWKEDLGHYIYVWYWEPDMTTKELIRLLKKYELIYFLHRAHYVKVIWELDLLTGEPVMPPQNISISVPERYGVEDIIRWCPECSSHMLHHVIKDGVEMWECFKVDCPYQELIKALEVSNVPKN